MLKIEHVTKDFTIKEQVTHALNDVSIAFRKAEFVCILGPSGCGKTTLLNIIGGLDKPTSGNVMFNGKCTSRYNDSEWNDFRNKQIGFVFQNYNLINHQTVLKNVEMPLILANVPKKERKSMAMAALAKVGLAEQAKKHPLQLSGGQMQRVAIARALVNNPDIILADEPTGALDSDSGVQVMELLKEISKEKLVITVTHNNELAEKYSTRIIRMSDGTVTGDTHTYNGNYDSIPPQKKKTYGRHKTSAMSLGTAISLSFSNLLSKRGRTALTALAGSIGIIGIMLVLALSNGATNYITSVEEDALSQYPVTINETNMDVSAILSLLTEQDDTHKDAGGTEDIYVNKVLGNVLSNINEFTSKNDLSALKTYIEENFDESYGYVKYDYGVSFDAYCNYIGDSERYMKVNPFLEAITDVMPSAFSGLTDKIEQYADMLTVWDEITTNTSLLESQYELLGNSKFPENYDEVIIVVDKNNCLNDYTLFSLGLTGSSEIISAMSGDDTFSSKSYTVNDLLSLEYYVMTGSDYHTQNTDGSWTSVTVRSEQRRIEFVEAHGVKLKVVGVVRPKDGVEVTSINGNIGYTSALVTYLSARAENSQIVKAQLADKEHNILTGESITESEYSNLMLSYGVADESKPKAINIYASSFESKSDIINFLETYNATSDKNVKYSDNLSIIMQYVEQLTQTITGVLVGFASISLVVSGIMNAIIVYTSVLERRKEIGILRSMGARKKDISNIFIAESSLIGFNSGAIGILFAYLISWGISVLLGNLLGVSGLVSVLWWHPLMMMGISIVLAILAGFIPARIASGKKPVECLRVD